jgi:predicted nucleotidyltransferase
LLDEFILPIYEKVEVGAKVVLGAGAGFSCCCNVDICCIMQHNSCIMQQKQPLDYLMPRIRQQVLAAILLDLQKTWTLANLASSLSLHHATVQRELTTLENAGVIIKQREGGRTNYVADNSCPFLPELRTILAKTIGMVGNVRSALTALESDIEVSFIFGSIAAGKGNSGSDIDLMVIGEVSLRELSGMLRPLEHEIGREVNPSVYTASEFHDKLSSKSHFLTSVMEADKLFVIGEQIDLARLA